MDSGLARFVVLVALFFLLTGDLAGMVKHVFEETVHGGGGGKGQQNSAATGPPIRQGGRSAAAADKRAANEEDADDIKEFGKGRKTAEQSEKSEFCARHFPNTHFTSLSRVF